MPGRIKGDRPDSSAGPTTSPRDAREVTLHRVRVGVTGLAVVFLLTILAAAILSLLGQDEHGTTRLANGMVVTNGSLPPEAPKEPLAELGVAPGNVPPGNAATAAVVPAKRPVASPHK